MKLNDSQRRELEKFLKDEHAQAKSQNERLVKSRAEATKYYIGDLPESDRDDQSRYTSTDVHDVVQLMLPSLLEMFAGAEEVVHFSATDGKKYEEEAKQRTAMVNYVCTEDNDWVTTLVSWWKDALLKKIGWVKVYRDKSVRCEVTEYEGISEEDYMALVIGENGEVDDDIRVVSEERLDPEIVVDTDPATGQQVQREIVKYNVKISRKYESKKIVISPVPPEEVYHEKGARAIDDNLLYICHVLMKTKSELISMGYSKEEIEEAVNTGNAVDSTEQMAREADNTTVITEGTDSRGILYIEHYVLYDLDDDGIDERYCITTLGDQMNIVNIEGTGLINLIPFTPDPEPHTVIGHCPSDFIIQTQRVKTQIVRDILDNLASVVNPRPKVVTGRVQVDDIFSSDFGAPIRVNSPDDYQVVTIPFVGQEALATMQYIDEDRESKTGISKTTEALDPKALQSTTQEAVGAVIRAVDKSITFIARLFAESSLKKLFLVVDELARKYPDKDKIIRIGGEYVPVDPAQWRAKLNVKVKPGAISKTKEQWLAVIMGIMTKQEQILQIGGIANNPLVSLQQYANALKRFAQFSGVDNPDDYFTTDIDPQVIQQMNEQAQQQAQMNPDQQLVQQDLQHKTAQIMLKGRELDLKRQQMEKQDSFNRDKLDVDLMRAIVEIEKKYGFQMDQTLINHIMQQATQQRTMESQRADSILNHIIGISNEERGRQHQSELEAGRQNFTREQSDADRRFRSSEAGRSAQQD